MSDYLPQPSEWDELVLGEDADSPITSKRSYRRHAVAAQRHDSAVLEAMAEALTLEEIILLTRVAISHPLAKRLKEILEPEDIEEDGWEPRLLAESVKSFLKFCLRAAAFLDERFEPGRTYAGEVGLQFIDARLGDLSVRFLDDGRALVAVVARSWRGSCQCDADDLLTDRDLFVVSRWLEPVDG